MNITSQGYYKEMPHGNPEGPSIKDFIGKEDRSLIDKICAYLQAGIPLAVTPGVVEDVICPQKGIAGSPSSFTDGTWVWPGDLSYYVKNYQLKLPDEFIHSMIEHDWAIPITPEEIDLDNLKIDGKAIFD